ncbi:hypothetical protein MKX01_021780 [Papaver californicum]|nr:hypothetical protein MKX01_021780 [Papaver californicum]
MEMDLSNPKFLAAIDMGSNSFKLSIVRAESNGKFLVIDHYKEPEVLGRGMISNSSSISPESIIKATLALKKFNQILQKNHKIYQTHIVATSAICLYGDLQCLPVHDKTVLAIYIGGGSTEFVIGKSGKVLFSISLKLGHVSLTDEFVKGEKTIANLRDYILKEIGFDIAVGSSGTIKSIEKAVSLGYGCDLNGSVVAIRGEFSRDWKFNKEELVGVVEKLCEDGDDDEEIKRNGLFKRRSVSEYALGEGVIAETLVSCCEDYDIKASARWLSVTKLAARFNTDKRMKLASLSVGIAKNGQHLHGYSTEEVELIALLARHHRKKFPKSTQGSLEGFPKEVKEKFKILCAIMRISVAVQHCKLMTYRKLETASCQEGFKLVFDEKSGQSLPPGEVKLSAENVEAELKSELNHFQEVVKMRLLIAVTPRS